MKLKNHIILSLCFGLALFQQCTTPEKDENKQTIANDTGMVWQFHDSSHANVYADPVSALKFAHQEKELSERLNYEKGIVRSLCDIGNVLWITGNYPEAIEQHLTALRISERINNSKLRARCLGNMSIVYNDMNDYNNAIFYGRQAMFLDSLNNEQDKLLVDYINLGEFYESIKPDSSLHFQNKALESAIGIGKTDQLGRIYLNLGRLNSRPPLDNSGVALQHLLSSLPLLDKKSDFHSLNQAFLEIAKIYDSKGVFDSSFYYTQKAYSTALKGKYSLGLLNANLKMYNLYKNRNKDSSLKYLEAVKDAKDSLYSIEKAMRTQNLTFMEQLRQSAIKIEQEKRHKAYIHNLEFAAIAAFIPLFFGIIILLGYVRVKPTVVESLGLFGLLLFFEFLALFLHHIFAKITDEQPIFMLPLLMIAAAVMVPFHHKVQVYVRAKLLAMYTKKKSKTLSTKNTANNRKNNQNKYT